MLTESAGRFAIRYGLLREAPDTQAVYDGLYAASPVSFWLDSSATGDGSARFSFLGDDRGPLSETITGCGGTVSVRDRRGVRAEPGELSGVLDTRLADRRIGPTCLPFDFVGGYVGYCGPERGQACGPDQASGDPDAAWLFADRVVAVDHRAGITYLLAVEDGRLGVRIAADAWIVDTMRRLRGLPPPVDPLPVLSAVDGRSPVERVQDGYRRLRRSHPAPYAALLRFGETMLLSTASGSALRAFTGQDASVPPHTAACLRAVDEPGTPEWPETGGDPALRSTRIGYFGLGGGVDLSLLTPVPVPWRAAAAFRHPAEPLVGAAEPAA